MLTTHRKQQILSILKRDGQVIAKDVSRSMDVSEDTIRRDLREMAQRACCFEYMEVRCPHPRPWADFAGRESITAEGKLAIGRAAAKMIHAGQVVILDGGTTARQVARHIPLDLKATVVTHSPTIALELVDHRDVEVILIGGRLFKHSVVAVGAAAIEAISEIHADTYFMGVTGVHAKTGLTTGDYEEAAVKRRRAMLPQILSCWRLQKSSMRLRLRGRAPHPTRSAASSQKSGGSASLTGDPSRSSKFQSSGLKVPRLAAQSIALSGWRPAHQFFLIYSQCSLCSQPPAGRI